MGQEQISLTKQLNRLLVVGGLTNDRHTVFKFNEPEGTPRKALFNGLKDGSYTKAFLIEEFEYRSLCFALDGSTQSEMRLDDPYALVNEYTRKMMGFLAFQPRPERVLLIGLAAVLWSNIATGICLPRRSRPLKLIRTYWCCDHILRSSG